MARWSDPDEGLTQDRFRVWSVGGDYYSRAELEENWDTLDAMIGRPTDGVTVWPPLDERGNGKGMWLYFQQLFAERGQIGDLKYAWAPTETALVALITAQDAAGWAVADGRIIDAADHDFGLIDEDLDGEDVALPNLVGRYVIGVADDSTVGTEGGITTSDGNDNFGEQGAETQEVSVTIPAHTHSIPAHNHSLAHHNHNINHTHTIAGGDDLTGNSRFGICYDLKTSAINAVFTSAEGDSEPGFSHPVPHATHTHSIESQVVSAPSITSSDAVGQNTDLSSVGTTGASSSSAATDTIDMKPLSVGMVPFIKVRNIVSV